MPLRPITPKGIGPAWHEPPANENYDSYCEPDGYFIRGPPKFEYPARFAQAPLRFNSPPPTVQH